MNTDKIEVLIRKMKERNGVGGKRALPLPTFGARLTNEQKDELLICSRIAQAKIGARDA